MQEMDRKIKLKFLPKATLRHFSEKVLKILINVTLKVKDKDEQCDYITQQESEWKKAMTNNTEREFAVKKMTINVLFFQDWRIATTRTASL